MSETSKEWKTLHSTYGKKNTLWQIREDTLINPRNEKEITITVLDGNDAANVVAITSDQHILMIEQYRFGINGNTLEIPGGMVDDHESHETAVRRELEEETSFQSDHWTYLGNIPSNPVFQNALIHHYLATEVVATGHTRFDDAENIELKKIPVSEVLRMMKNNEIKHPHTVNALWLAFLKMGLI